MYGDLEKKCKELETEVEKLKSELEASKKKTKEIVSVPIYKSDSAKLIEKLRSEVLALKKIQNEQSKQLMKDFPYKADYQT